MVDHSNIGWTEATLFGGALPRRCSRCRLVKPVDQFKADRSRPDRHGYICKSCERVSDIAVPNRIERTNARKEGRAWCRACKSWQPTEYVKQGLCGEHRRQADRNRYAVDSAHRERRRAHSTLRKRGVDRMPEMAREYYLELFDGGCAYCDGRVDTWDHVIPVTKGGATAPDNILPACIACNSSKRDRDLDEWLAATDRSLSPQAIEHLAHFQVL